jgi:aminopeptidase-like protein
MTGIRNPILFQHSRQGVHLLDRICDYVLKTSQVDFRESPFRGEIVNDENVINGPGVNIPCLSLSRWPYDDYHTSDDTPDRVDWEKVVEVADVVEKVVRLFCQNAYPRRRFRGPVFLSGHGLWVDWRQNRELNRAIDDIMHRLEGDLSFFDIAEQVGLDFHVVRDYLLQFEQKKLIDISWSKSGETRP